VSFSCDVNVLLYASDASNPVYMQARGTIERWAKGDDLWYLMWPTLIVG
jgi:predicted nucleic acid-binding protein